MQGNLELRSALSVLAVAAAALLLAPLPVSGEESTYEVSLSGPDVSGDPDGQGEATVTVNSETNQVEARLSYSNIAEPTGMHIREGATGSEGHVVVPFEIESEEEGTLEGRRTANPDTVEAILASPEEYYLVVLTDEYPVGALRGPLGQ